jgi:hypothetical protein
LSASYSELTGQPTPSQTTVLPTTEMSVLETVAPLVMGTGTTKTVPLSVVSTDPPMIGTLQAQGDRDCGSRSYYFISSYSRVTACRPTY